MAVVGIAAIVSGCSLRQKNGPAQPDFSKPTATFTPSATGIFTSTITATPTITPTPTITATPTITFTHVNATDTVTGTPTQTVTPTATATTCSASYYNSSYSFDSSDMCWKYELTPTGVSPTAAWDPSTGYSGGSVSLNIPFTGTGQQAVYAASFGSTPMNLAGKRITAYVRCDSWLNHAGTGAANINSYPGGLKLIVKTGSSWVYGSNAWQNVTTTGNWMTLTFDVSSPSSTGSASYDPTQVVQIGLELNTNGTIDGAGFGTAVFHLDSVTIADINTPTPTATPGGAAGWTFDASLSGWGIDTSGSSSSVTATSAIAWDGSVDAASSSSSGSVSLFIPFTGTSQQFLVADSFPSSPITLTGKAVTVKVRVDSCVGSDLVNSPLLAQVVLKSGSSWVYGAGTWANLTATGTWFDVTIPSVNALSTSYSGFAPGQVVQAAVAFQTGSSGTYGNTVIHIDNWLYQ